MSKRNEKLRRLTKNVTMRQKQLQGFSFIVDVSFVVDVFLHTGKKCVLAPQMSVGGRSFQPQNNMSGHEHFNITRLGYVLQPKVISVMSCNPAGGDGVGQCLAVEAPCLTTKDADGDRIAKS